MYIEKFLSGEIKYIHIQKKDIDLLPELDAALGNRLFKSGDPMTRVVPPVLKRNGEIYIRLRSGEYLFSTAPNLEDGCVEMETILEEAGPNISFEEEDVLAIFKE